MKQVTLKNSEADPIKFLLRGQPHSASAVEVEIDEKGIVVDDNDAELLLSRLGAQIAVTELDEKQAAKLAKDAAKEAEKATGGDEGKDGDDAPKASDAVKKLAEEAGIDLATITGSGTNGNIVKADVEAAIKAKEEADKGGE